jgi:trimeric autotransporter adhesin
LKRSRSVALLSVVACVILFGGCGGGNTPKFNATPTVTGLFPSVITAGSDGFTMAVTGTGFISDSAGTTVVNWNGSPRSTSFNANTGQLSVQILQSDIAAPTSVIVTATNPAPGGGTSLNGATFTIEPFHPGFTLTSLDPSSASAGGDAFMLTANGTGFATGDVITWNGTQLITTVAPMQSIQATAQVTKDLIATEGTASVSVATSDPTVATTSTTFTINGKNAAATPGISSLSSSMTAHGGGDFQMRVSGSGFARNAVVLWNGSRRATSFLSPSELVVLIPASDIAEAGNAAVAVSNPPPGGGSSPTLLFKID